MLEANQSDLVGGFGNLNSLMSQNATDISYLNLKTIEYSSITEAYGVGLSYYCITFSVVILPISLLY